MDLEKRYKTSGGVECNILQLVKMEPEWAANRIQQGELAEATLKLKKSICSKELRMLFFKETGLFWENSQEEPDIEYVNWLESKIGKL